MILGCTSDVELIKEQEYNNLIQVIAEDKSWIPPIEKGEPALQDGSLSFNPYKDWELSPLEVPKMDNNQ